MHPVHPVSTSPLVPPPASPPSAGARAIQARVTYWRRVRALTVGLLGLWLLVALGSPWFAGELSHWHLGHFPFGFWLNAQGAILVFVALVTVYAWVMDHLDDALLDTLAQADGGLESGPIDGASR